MTSPKKERAVKRGQRQRKNEGKGEMGKIGVGGKEDKGKSTLES